MVFDQLQHGGDSGGGRRTRTLLCKKLDDGNSSVLLDLYYSIFNTEKFSLQSRYDFLLLHTSLCIHRGCFSGRLFLFEVVSWAIETGMCVLNYTAQSLRFSGNNRR